MLIEYIWNTFPQCDFVHWYPIMCREAGALNACASIVRVCVWHAQDKRFGEQNLYCRYYSSSESTIHRRSQASTALQQYPSIRQGLVIRAHDHLSKEYFASSCRWKSWWFSGNDLSSECRYPSDRGIGYGEWMLCTGRIRWFRYRLLHFLKKNRSNGPVPKWFKFLKSQTQSATWSVAQQFNVDVKLELIMLIVLRTR